MCGLFGVLRHDTKDVPSRALLLDTARRLQHRGPDGHGIHAEPGVGLVHTRLSLLDLSDRASQPFWDATGRYCLIYNGELYNYLELRSRLENRGSIFRTTSDTEVLLEALIHFGAEATLPQLDGMFAFAMYDTQEKSLLLARDRFGIKPLYVHDSSAVFAFASTVEAMRPWLPIEPDMRTMSSFLHGFNGPMSGRSFYDQITILPPGSIVRVRLKGSARFESCLTMTDLIDSKLGEELARIPRKDLVDQAEQLLLSSVESQLAADVPVGAFCSGGVDSSLLMAMACRFHSDLRVFHADITGPLSERAAAQRLADHLKLDLKVVSVCDHHFFESIPEVVEHFGFPFANQTAVPVMMVSQLVHQHGIKAVLCGEGSDECYLGYPWLVPDLRATIRHLPARLYRKVRGAHPSPQQAPSRDHQLVAGISSKFVRERASEAFDSAMAPVYQKQALTQSPASDGNLSYILRSLLHRNDSMGMSASVEARFPFLDGRLVKMAVNLPYDSKVRFSPFVFDAEHLFFRDKWIIRQIAARYLPPELSQRKKRMFPTNAFQRLQVSDRFFENSFISDSFGIAQAGLRHLLSNASSSLRVRLMLLEAWGQICVNGSSKETLSASLQHHVKVAAA